MIFKKFLAAAAALVLLLSLVACNADPGTETGTDAPAASASPSQTAVSQTTLPPFQELVLVDDESCTVIVKGTDPDNLFGYTLQVYLENRTDKELIFTVDKVSVNGFMCDPFWAATVTAGKKANEQITFSESDFKANGIEAVSEISFTLQVYDSNDWSADYLVDRAFTIPF